MRGKWDFHSKLSGKTLESTKQVSDMVQGINAYKPLRLPSGTWAGKEQEKNWVTSLEATESTGPEMKVVWQEMTAAERERPRDGVEKVLEMEDRTLAGRMNDSRFLASANG